MGWRDASGVGWLGRLALSPDADPAWSGAALAIGGGGAPLSGRPPAWRRRGGAAHGRGLAGGAGRAVQRGGPGHRRVRRPRRRARPRWRCGLPMAERGGGRRGGCRRVDALRQRGPDLRRPARSAGGGPAGRRQRGGAVGVGGRAGRAHPLRWRVRLAPRSGPRPRGGGRARRPRPRAHLDGGPQRRRPGRWLVSQARRRARPGLPSDGEGGWLAADEPGALGGAERGRVGRSGPRSPRARGVWDGTCRRCSAPSCRSGRPDTAGRARGVSTRSARRPRPSAAPARPMAVWTAQPMAGSWPRKRWRSTEVRCLPLRPRLARPQPPTTSAT